MNAATEQAVAVPPKGPFETRAEYEKRVKSHHEVDLGEDPKTITLTLQVVRQPDRFQVTNRTGNVETGMPGDFIARYKGPNGYSREFVLPAEIVLGYSNLTGKAREVALSVDTDSPHMRTPVLSVPKLTTGTKGKDAVDAAAAHDKKALEFQMAPPGPERNALRVLSRKDKRPGLPGVRDVEASSGSRGVVAVPAAGPASKPAATSGVAQPKSAILDKR